MRLTKNKALLQHSIEIVIPFYDLDPLCIVWHGNYLKYFEDAREALLNHLNIGYKSLLSSDYIFPIVESHVKYIRPLIHEQKIIVTAGLLEYENRIKISYQIHDKESQQKLSEGYTTQVTVSKETRELEFESPKVFIEGIQSCLEKA